jgi:hypothetical protein
MQLTAPLGTLFVPEVSYNALAPEGIAESLADTNHIVREHPKQSFWRRAALRRWKEREWDYLPAWGRACSNYVGSG